VEDDTRMRGEPAPDVGRLVCRRVVEDDVQLTIGKLAIEFSEKSQEE
jgi:hypothetical protein